MVWSILGERLATQNLTRNVDQSICVSEHETLYSVLMMSGPSTCNKSVDSVSVQVKWRNIHFIMWDIGGQESLRQAWSTYYSGTQFVILVVDSTDRERLAISREELYRMLGNDVSVCVCVWRVEREDCGCLGLVVYCELFTRC